jgi:hypothetical protein
MAPRYQRVASMWIPRRLSLLRQWLKMSVIHASDFAVVRACTSRFTSEILSGYPVLFDVPVCGLIAPPTATLQGQVAPFILYSTARLASWWSSFQARSIGVLTMSHLLARLNEASLATGLPARLACLGRAGIRP